MCTVVCEVFIRRLIQAKLYKRLGFVVILNREKYITSLAASNIRTERMHFGGKYVSLFLTFKHIFAQKSSR